MGYDCNCGTVNAIQSGHNNSLRLNISDKEERLLSAINNLLNELKTQDDGTVSKDLIQTIEESLVELKCPEKKWF